MSAIRVASMPVAALLLSLLSATPVSTAPSEEDVELKVVEGRELTNAVGMRLRRIPKGTFQMGADRGEPGADPRESPRHEVTISKDFYVGVTEVTQGQWKKVMDNNPSHFSKTGGGRNQVQAFTVRELDEFPVETVSWNDAQAFLKKLNARRGTKETGHEYRLPTEAEWEYCCRAGTKTAFHYGGSLDSKRANLNGNFPFGGAAVGPYLGRTTRVASYKPNGWGLYDMHGNVWELCHDWHQDNYYASSPKVDPQGPLQGTLRNYRGGSYENQAVHCRSAWRNHAQPEHRNDHLGFRVALVAIR